MSARRLTPFPVLFVVLCAAYLLVIPRSPAWLSAAGKVLPIAALVAWSAWRAPRRDRRWLTLGLLASASGDVFLALSPRTLFLAGVGAFLLAHVFYIVTFRPYVRFSRSGLLRTAIVAAWCAAVALVVVPRLGALRLPVAAYMLVIATMGVSAALATGQTLTLYAGALAFIVSDSALAVDRFVSHVSWAGWVVMTTYYAGQYLIVSGVIGRRSGP